MNRTPNLAVPVLAALCLAGTGCQRQPNSTPASGAVPTGRAGLNRLQPPTRGELEKALTSPPLQRVANDLRALILGEVAIAPQAAQEDTIEVGASKLGGSPDLPRGTEWPEWNGVPLGFVAQFRLSQVAPCDPSGALPKMGMLYFFYDGRQITWGLDPESRNAWRVLYHATESEGLARAKPPEDLPTESSFRACAVTSKAAASLPASVTSPELEPLMLSDAEVDAYYGLLGDAHGTKLLGHGEYIQNDVRLECELAQEGITAEAGRVDDQTLAASHHWRLLLQVDSDDDAGMMWGDAGMLYYLIRDEDLDARNFDNVWMALQCY